MADEGSIDAERIASMAKNGPKKGSDKARGASGTRSGSRKTKRTERPRSPSSSGSDREQSSSRKLQKLAKSGNTRKKNDVEVVGISLPNVDHDISESDDEGSFLGFQPVHSSNKKVASDSHEEYDQTTDQAFGPHGYGVYPWGPPPMAYPYWPYMGMGYPEEFDGEYDEWENEPPKDPTTSGSDATSPTVSVEGGVSLEKHEISADNEEGTGPEVFPTVAELTKKMWNKSTRDTIKELYTKHKVNDRQFTLLMQPYWFSLA